MNTDDISVLSTGIRLGVGRSECLDPISGRDKRLFFLLNVQIGSGAHPASRGYNTTAIFFPSNTGINTKYRFFGTKFNIIVYDLFI